MKNTNWIRILLNMNSSYCSLLVSSTCSLLRPSVPNRSALLERNLLKKKDRQLSSYLHKRARKIGGVGWNAATTCWRRAWRKILRSLFSLSKTELGKKFRLQKTHKFAYAHFGVETSTPDLLYSVLRLSNMFAWKNWPTNKWHFTSSTNLIEYSQMRIIFLLSLLALGK